MRSTSAGRPPTRLSRADRTGGLPAAAAHPLVADPDHVESISRSHERCQALGVSRIDDPDHSPIARPDLQISLERNRRLYDHAAPVMSLLRDQIARTESMVLLTDAVGTIIHSVGDDDFLGRASKVALRTGANWSEGAKGTNAIGTALINETPTLVHADEHFLHANQFLTCSAAPILDPRGNILGVLDVSGDFRSYHKHTLALVRMSARMIENRWLTEDFGHAMRLHFHSRPEFIGTLMEGILAVAEDGRIVGANRGALEHLGMSGATVRMHTLETLFGASLAEVADHCRARVTSPLSLNTANGHQFAAFARCNWLMWSPVPGAEDAASRPAAAELIDGDGTALPGVAHAGGALACPPGAALAQLRTGDAQVEALVEKIRRVLDRDIPILVLGETGTGKELLARAIHADSARARQPFVAVNCASIPETLIEAELFGYDEGAFTGARRKGAPGKIVQANGGTLFLDEIGDMPLPLQAHLLRVLQERQVTPLGSTKSVAVDLAIICATHRNLRHMIDRQAFREDLYYRLNGLAVRLPALRERTDLLALVRRLVDAQGGPRRHQLAPEVQGLFERYKWPGNVRQLFHVLRTACVMAGREPLITRAHLPDDFLEEAEADARAAGGDATAAGPQGAAAPPQPQPVAGLAADGASSGVAAAAASPSSERSVGAAAFANIASAANSASGTGVASVGNAAMATGTTSVAIGAGGSAGPVDPEAVSLPVGRLEDLELDMIRRTLDAVGGNISEASKRLGISRNTIYRKLRWNQPA
ncbi:MAG: sigma-54-dependent Fis family transcriptional regulator [Burkholderiales bacterium]|nr:sigma-54-dependent Fis family transcriptional regulator [Burkholderiales bacterium]